MPATFGSLTVRGSSFQRLGRSAVLICSTAAALACLQGQGIAATPDATTCASPSGKLAIAACTRLLASAKYGTAAISTILFNRALAYARANDAANAKADVTLAIRFDPRNVEAFRLRGVIYATMGDFDRAARDDAKALALSPNDAQAKKQLADAKAKIAAAGHKPSPSDQKLAAIAARYLKKGKDEDARSNYAAAFADLTKALGLDPTLAEAYSTRGDAYLGMRNWDAAIVDNMASVRLEPKNGHFWFSLGISYFAVHLDAVALASFRRASELQPRAAGYIDMIAETEEMMGEIRAAYEDYKRALAINPKDTRAKQQLAALSKRLKPTAETPTRSDSGTKSTKRKLATVIMGAPRRERAASVAQSVPSTSTRHGAPAVQHGRATDPSLRDCMSEQDLTARLAACDKLVTHAEAGKNLVPQMQALELRAKTYVAMKRYRAALDDLSKDLGLLANNVGALMAEAQIYSNADMNKGTSHLSDAVTALTKVIDLEHTKLDKARDYVVRGHVYLKMWTWFDKKKFDDAVAQRQLAAAQGFTAPLDKAAKDFKAAIAIYRFRYPSNRDANKGLKDVASLKKGVSISLTQLKAKVAASRGAFKEAYDDYENILTLVPTDSDAKVQISILRHKLLAKGHALETKGAAEAAAQRYFRVARSGKDDVSAQAKAALSALDGTSLGKLCHGEACAALQLKWDGGCLKLTNAGKAVIDYRLNGLERGIPGGEGTRSIPPSSFDSFKARAVFALGVFVKVKYCNTVKQGSLTLVKAVFDHGKPEATWIAYTTQEKTAEALIAKGRTALNANDLDGAVKAFSKAIAAANKADKIESLPGSPADTLAARAYDGLGMAFAQQGKLLGATRNLYLAIMDKDYDVSYLVDLADVLARQGYYWSHDSPPPRPTLPSGSMSAPISPTNTTDKIMSLPSQVFDPWTFVGAVGILSRAAKLDPDNKQISKQLSDARVALARQQARLHKFCKGTACGDLEMHWAMGCLVMKNAGKARIEYAFFKKKTAKGPRMFSSQLDLEPNQKVDGLFESAPPLDRNQLLDRLASELVCTTVRKADLKSIGAVYFHPRMNCGDNLLGCALSK